MNEYKIFFNNFASLVLAVLPIGILLAIIAYILSHIHDWNYSRRNI